MNKDKRLHLSIVNTYNVLTNKASYDDIFMSNVPYIYVDAHKEVTFKHINNMIKHFEDIEMYEQCAELMRVRREDFNDDGSKIRERNTCSCDNCEVGVYSLYSRCKSCNLRIL